MNCDHWMDRIETGGVCMRLLARRHARRCPQCSAALRQIGQIKQALAEADPLSTAQRRLWQQAAESPMLAIAGRRRRASVRAVAAAAAILAVGAAVWTWSPFGGDGPKQAARHKEQPVTPAIEPEQASEPVLRQLDEMESGLKSLSNELDRLAQQAALLDERRQAGELLAARSGP